MDPSVELFISSLAKELNLSKMYLVFILGAICGFIVSLPLYKIVFTFSCWRRAAQQAYLAQIPEEIVRSSQLAKRKICYCWILAFLTVIIIALSVRL